MNTIEYAGRLVAGLAVGCLLAGCGSTVPAAPTGAPVPTLTAAPTVTIPPMTLGPTQGDSSTAVSIHIENPECITDTAGITVNLNGVRHMTGATRHCRYDGADPRFSGWSDIVVNSDCYLADHSRCVRWGTEAIPAPGGAWVGTFRGGQLGNGIRFNFEVLEGTGAYEGWSYVLYLNMAALGGEEWVIDGLIYQGPPPPLPELRPLQDPAYDGSTAADIHFQEGNPAAWECVTDRSPATTYVNGVRQLRGATRHCLYDGADPRFLGWSDVEVSADCYSEDGSKCVRWGTERIPGPDGDWVGMHAGGSIGSPDGEWRGSFEVLEGTGAYQGWTCVAYMDMAALGGEEWVGDGFIYHGPPPPVPSLP